MSPSPERTVVTVEINGEDYNIRALASPEYTRECAAYVDRTLRIVRQGSPLPHKAAVLAALALADELFQARSELEALRDEVKRRADDLAGQIEQRLAATHLAGGL